MREKGFVMNRVGLLLIAIAFGLATMPSTEKAVAAGPRSITITCPPFVGVNLSLATDSVNVNLLPADASWEGAPGVVAAFDYVLVNTSGGRAACFYHINFSGTTKNLFDAAFTFACADPKHVGTTAVSCVVNIVPRAFTTPAPNGA
jgi:hypothetical protein